MYDALTSTYALSCPNGSPRRVPLSSFRMLERLPGAAHPAVYRVTYACACGSDHAGLVSHDDLDWAPLGASLGAPIDRAGRVLVQPDLTIPGHPDVYVVGDLAALKGPDGQWLPGVAQVALQQAAHAARNIVATIAGRDRQPFVYRNYGNLATIGRNSAVADLPRLRFDGYPAWLFWLFVHISQLIGFRNRLTVMTQWAASYLTYQRSVRLITGDEPGQGDAHGRQ